MDDVRGMRESVRPVPGGAGYGMHLAEDGIGGLRLCEQGIAGADLGLPDAEGRIAWPRRPRFPLRDD